MLRIMGSTLAIEGALPDAARPRDAGPRRGVDLTQFAQAARAR